MDCSEGPLENPFRGIEPISLTSFAYAKLHEFHVINKNTCTKNNYGHQNSKILLSKVRKSKFRKNTNQMLGKIRSGRCLKM